MHPTDLKLAAVRAALEKARRPLSEGEIAQRVHYTKKVVRLRLAHLERAGLVEELWLGARGPLYRIKVGAS